MDRPGIGRPSPDQDRTTEIAGRIEPADGSGLLVTTHCVDRFWERAASGCTNFRAALERLRLLAGQFGEVTAAPGWAGTLDADRYVAVSDDIGLIVRDDWAVTCVVHGGIGDRSRAAQPRPPPAPEERRSLRPHAEAPTQPRRS